MRLRPHLRRIPPIHSIPSITMSPEPAQQTNSASKKKNNNKKKKNAAKKAAAAAEEDARAPEVGQQDGVDHGEDDGPQSEVPSSPVTVRIWKYTLFMRARPN